MSEERLRILKSVLEALDRKINGTADSIEGAGI